MMDLDVAVTDIDIGEPEVERTGSAPDHAVAGVVLDGGVAELAGSGAVGGSAGAELAFGDDVLVQDDDLCPVVHVF